MKRITLFILGLIFILTGSIITDKMFENAKYKGLFKYEHKYIYT